MKIGLDDVILAWQTIRAWDSCPRLHGGRLYAGMTVGVVGRLFSEESSMQPWSLHTEG